MQKFKSKILVFLGGSLQVKVLKRTAQFSQQSSTVPSNTNSQNIKLNIPKKTSLFLEQANREIKQSIR